MAAATESCSICYDDYKGKKVQKVTCQYCPAHACRGCQQRYLLQTYEDPHCMECKRGWSAEFMSANFPLVFRNDTLRKHRRKILLEREKSMLPAMQVFVELKKQLDYWTKREAELSERLGFPYGDEPKNANTVARRRQQAHEKYYALNEKLQRLRVDIDDTKASVADKYLEAASPDVWNAKKAKLAEQRAARTKLKQELAILKRDYDEKHAAHRELSAQAGEARRQRAIYNYRYESDTGGADGDALPQRREFIMACPADGCRGFLSSAYKCGTCSKFTCSGCLVVLGDDKNVAHTCKPEEVESAKAIKSETRPCPKCGARIFKIDGCDQMWCTVEGCATAFSWQSGHVVTGRVHNPHYYEWLRRNGGGTAPREVGDIPCGGLPGYWDLVTAARNAKIYYSQEYLVNRDPMKRIPYGGLTKEMHTLTEIQRRLTELIADQLPKHPARPPAGMNKNYDVDYLMNAITEDEWKRQLEIAEARFIRKKEIGQILQTLTTAASDIMNGIVTRCNAVNPRNVDDLIAVRLWVFETALPELEQLRVFTNDALKDLGRRNKMAVPQIEPETWAYKPARILYKVTAKAKKNAATAAAAATATATEAS